MVGTRQLTFVRRAIGLAAIALVIGGCGESAREPDPTPTIAQAHRDEIDRALASELSPLERAILSDYVITDAEMKQAEDAFRACLADAGYGAHFEVMGRSIAVGLSEADRNRLIDEYQHDIDAGMAAEDAVVNPCAQGTVMRVGTIYAEMTANPEALDMPELLRICLDEAGAAQEAATLADDELEEALRNGVFGPVVEGHCATGVYQ